MNWTYAYKGHTEIVSDDEKVQIQRVTSNGIFIAIVKPVTPPEAVAEVATKQRQPKQIDTNE